MFIPNFHGGVKASVIFVKIGSVKFVHYAYWRKLTHLNAELNPICHLLALLGAHPIFHVSRIRVNFVPPLVH
jgi:hypothetical protein